LAPGFDHGGVKTNLAHIDIDHPAIEAFFIKLFTTLPNPSGGLAQLLTRRSAMLRFRSSVTSEVVS